MASGLPDHYAPASDGLPALEVGRWTLEKHHYLRRYIYAFCTGMKTKWPSRVYVDLFSGAGRCIIDRTREEVDGSPLLAIGTRDGFTELYFNDSEAVAVNALMSRVGETDRIIHYSVNDCNRAAREIGARLDRQSLTLAFVDPFNWEIEFSSMEALSGQARIDIVLTFHSGSIKRAADYEPESLHAFFGGQEWKAEYDESRRKGRREGTRVLLDAYEGNLRRLGFAFIKDHVLVRNAQRTPLYHLVFASRHERGDDFWEKVTSRDLHGQERLL